jgi:two-component system OmpR family response regulator
MHVVLIEDDEKIGGFVSQGLKQEGHVVSWARTGDEGLALAREAGADLAIVDVMLPGKDGLTIIRALREKKSVIPVIVLSARADVERSRARSRSRRRRLPDETLLLRGAPRACQRS